MIVLELACLVIVATYVAFRMRRAPARGARVVIAVELLSLAIAGFVGEDTVIRAHGYYAYATGWSLRLDHVPIVIVLVWPVVIHSAWTVARGALGSRSQGPTHVATVAAAIVLADASLIEPIAVRAGLWRWTEPGLFGVPLVGIAGWAFFAWAAVQVLERARALAAKASVVVVAPALTHALILATYWCGFRWAQGEVPAARAVVAVWSVSLAIAVAIRARRAQLEARGGTGLDPGELLVRLPGALFFFVLLAMTWRGLEPFPAPDAARYVGPADALGALAAYAVAFAPPYLVALAALPHRITRKNAVPAAPKTP